ncbi:hypothetical protein [Pseudacidovorax sp. NFM-22]|uniref:hypothetical protein n=1 Tax=Pseudacidovorax sp. NFM-22 TaxID=2744469 RepID=UPI001F19FB4F|nr:hypothetical protein [Pseudacidovorax sp. NFM-22]
MVPSKEWLDWASLIGGIGSGVAGVGAVAAFWQLRLLKTQSVTSFEDGLVDEYRDIAKELPLDALLGADMSPQDVAQALPAFYRYFDLCNQQLFLHQEGRIRKATWALWRDGIVSNLQRPAFARAWAEIAAKATGDFEELRALCPPQSTAPKGAA